jgi:hypothetical protein
VVRWAVIRRLTTKQHKNTTKRNIFILLICSLLILGGVIFVSANASPFAGKDPQTVGKMIGEALKSVLKSNQEPFTSPESNPDRIVGEFYGEKVTAIELDYRAAFYKISGSANPLQDAWESLIAEKYIFKVARENNLTPSQEELVKFCQEMRTQIESAPGGKEYADAAIEGLGLTPDEYWNEYKVKNEAPFHLSSQRVAAFWTENNIPETTKAEMLAPYINVRLQDVSLIEKYTSEL